MNINVLIFGRFCVDGLAMFSNGTARERNNNNNNNPKKNFLLFKGKNVAL